MEASVTSTFAELYPRRGRRKAGLAYVRIPAVHAAIGRQVRRGFGGWSLGSVTATS